MKKKDLEFGMVVKLRSGDLCIIHPEKNIDSRFISETKREEHKIHIRRLKDASWISKLSDYDDNLKVEKGAEKWDIVEIYKDYTLKELLWKRKEKVYVFSIIKFIKYEVENGRFDEHDLSRLKNKESWVWTCDGKIVEDGLCNGYSIAKEWCIEKEIEEVEE